MLAKWRRSLPSRPLFDGFGLDAACAVACSGAPANWPADDISGLLLAQQYMSCNEVTDAEESEDDRIEPEIGIAQSLGESADTDWLKPGGRKHQADQHALASER